MSVTFESHQDILCLEPKEEEEKRFQLEKKVKNNFFLAALVCFCPLYLYNSKSTNNFEIFVHTQVDLKE